MIILLHVVIWGKKEWPFFLLVQKWQMLVEKWPSVWSEWQIIYWNKNEAREDVQTVRSIKTVELLKQQRLIYLRLLMPGFGKHIYLKSPIATNNFYEKQ